MLADNCFLTAGQGECTVLQRRFY